MKLRPLTLKQCAAGLLLGLLLMLSGCFDYTEECRFDAEGKGKLSIVLDTGDLSPLERLAAATVKRNPFSEEETKKDLPAGIRRIEYREETKNERKIFYVTWEFSDLSKFAQWKNSGFEQLFKSLSLSRVGDTWAFSRTLAAKDKEQLENAKKHLTRSKIVFKLTGPGTLLKEQSNPARMEGENTCVWEGNFAELIEGKDGSGTAMKAQYFIGTPVWIKALIGVGVLLVVAIAIKLLLKKKSAPPAGAPTATETAPK